jgi:hypothetical protein
MKITNYGCRTRALAWPADDKARNETLSAALTRLRHFWTMA